MRCAICRQNNPSGAKYCRQCGKPLPSRYTRLKPLGVALGVVLVLAGAAFGIYTVVEHNAAESVRKHAEDKRLNEGAWDYWRNSANKLASVIRSSQLKQIAFTGLEYSGGVSIPLLGSTGYKESAERAQEGIFLLLQRIVAKSGATIRKGPKDSDHTDSGAGYFACKVVDFQESGRGVRAQTIRLELHRSADDAVLWADLWNVVRMAASERPLDLDSQP